jgi:tRNA nucleotidyltransferase/poly(A) polymerase
MPDYIFMLESRLSLDQRALLDRVQALAQGEQLNVYLTGGAVRDLLTGAALRDFDFTVEGNPARIVRELEKSGAKVVEENESLRHWEMVSAAEVPFSVAAARDEVYERPGAKPEHRWSTVIDDLRRRDFSINAIGLSLNPASRGLLLDPTNGLADIEKREVRVLTMHAFTNQPVRLMRILRFAARLGFAIESRTADWMALAFERELEKTITPVEVGRELRELGREENPLAVLKEWGKRGLLGLIHAKLAKRTPTFDRLVSLAKVKEAMAAYAYRPLLTAPVIAGVLGRLSSRELTNALSRLHLRTREIERVTSLDDEAQKVIKMLAGRKTKAPKDAYAFLEAVPLPMLAYILSEYSNATALGKIKNYLYKWKPLRQQLPVAELESLGVPRGPLFDKYIEAFFQAQLLGRAKNPQDRIPLLRKITGIKEPKPKPAAAEKGKLAKKEKGKLEAAGKEKAALHPAAKAAPAEPAKTGKAKPPAPVPKTAATKAEKLTPKPAAKAAPEKKYKDAKKKR